MLIHFYIPFCRYLPPEIGCLSRLEFLDLSFNKLKKLPNEIILLNALKSLKIAKNKLAELPSGLSRLRRLENLDLSYNRLTSLGPLQLVSMHSLQKLNLQVLPETEERKIKLILQAFCLQYPFFYILCMGYI